MYIDQALYLILDFFILLERKVLERRLCLRGALVQSSLQVAPDTVLKNKKNWKTEHIRMEGRPTTKLVLQ